MLSNRRALATVAIALLLTTSGCIGFLTGDEALTFAAEPAAVDDSAAEEAGYELAIFVLSAYQGAGIGTELVETLLGHGQAEGIDRVWLTVERWNDPAIALYRKVGFETSNSERFEQEMSIRLA